MEDKSTQIITEIMDARGYEITETSEDKMIASKEGHNIFILSVTENKLNTNTVKDLIAIMQENGLNHSIIIYNETITSGAKKIIETAEISHQITIECFDRAELQYNITKHRLQPEFLKCDETETAEIKAKWGSKLPVMLKVDPVARFYNYHRGDIIRITRKNGMITYRVVK